MGKKVKRSIHFDLSSQAIKDVGLSSSTVYEQMRSWFDSHGFKHDQLSGYVSVKPLSQKKLEKIVTQFMLENPLIIPCVERWRAVEIGREDNFIKDAEKFVRKKYPQYMDTFKRSVAIGESRNHSPAKNMKKTKAYAKDMIKQRAEKLRSAKRGDAPSHKPQSH
ncbi:hypothetical protein B9G54_04420 [Alloscardovia macacae]|uniref:Uncharacterized protein n=1 Tax=Alloscardovia macacae TaxID=1160091 RepID=A0A1Y2SU17_9BIFI|nr:hypothetical protein [Alloscardovia macacae]OTA26440.1 hypothetical protein B9G54_04420 [Alloscardovia macacae]OTA29880.1 hypothetical protein B9T39_02025 [Alloscardovia macacae]